MGRIELPHDAKAGPTKPAVRSVTLDALRLDADTHFVEVGSCTGAVTIEAAQRAGQVTAIERKAGRAEVTRKNCEANDVPVSGPESEISTDGGRQAAPVDIQVAEAPEGIPEDADRLFLGGSRNYEAVLDKALETDVERIVMNVSRLEVAGEAARAFRERDLLSDLLQVQVSHGYELAGATSFNSENPVYVLVGDRTEASL